MISDILNSSLIILKYVYRPNIFFNFYFGSRNYLAYLNIVSLSPPTPLYLLGYSLCVGDSSWKEHLLN